MTPAGCLGRNAAIPSVTAADKLIKLRREVIPSSSWLRSKRAPHIPRDTGDSSLDEADESRCRPKLGIGDELGLDKLDDPTAAFDRADPGGKDVLHPLHVRPIGEEEEVVVASSKTLIGVR